MNQLNANGNMLPGRQIALVSDQTTRQMSFIPRLRTTQRPRQLGRNQRNLLVIAANTPRPSVSNGTCISVDVARKPTLQELSENEVVTQSVSHVVAQKDLDEISDSPLGDDHSVLEDVSEEENFESGSEGSCEMYEVDQTESVCSGMSQKEFSVGYHSCTRLYLNKYTKILKNSYFKPKIFIVSRDKCMINCMNVNEKPREEDIDDNSSDVVVVVSSEQAVETDQEMNETLKEVEPEITTELVISEDTDKNLSKEAAIKNDEPEGKENPEETRVEVDQIPDEDGNKLETCDEVTSTKDLTEIYPEFQRGAVFIQAMIDEEPNPMIGLEYVMELWQRPGSDLLNYICWLCCETELGKDEVVDHVKSEDHQRRYVVKHFPAHGAEFEGCVSPLSEESAVKLQSICKEIASASLRKSPCITTELFLANHEPEVRNYMDGYVIEHQIEATAVVSNPTQDQSSSADDAVVIVSEEINVSDPADQQENVVTASAATAAATADGKEEIEIIDLVEEVEQENVDEWEGEEATEEDNKEEEDVEESDNERSLDKEDAFAKRNRKKGLKTHRPLCSREKRRVFKFRDGDRRFKPQRGRGRFLKKSIYTWVRDTSKDSENKNTQNNTVSDLPAEESSKKEQHNVSEDNLDGTEDKTADSGDFPPRVSTERFDSPSSSHGRVDKPGLTIRRGYFKRRSPSPAVRREHFRHERFSEGHKKFHPVPEHSRNPRFLRNRSRSPFQATRVRSRSPFQATRVRSRSPLRRPVRHFISDFRKKNPDFKRHDVPYDSGFKKRSRSRSRSRGSFTRQERRRSRSNSRDRLRRFRRPSRSGSPPPRKRSRSGSRNYRLKSRSPGRPKRRSRSTSRTIRRRSRSPLRDSDSKHFKRRYRSPSSSPEKSGIGLRSSRRFSVSPSPTRVNRMRLSPKHRRSRSSERSANNPAFREFARLHRKRSVSIDRERACSIPSDISSVKSFEEPETTYENRPHIPPEGAGMNFEPKGGLPPGLVFSQVNHLRMPYPYPPPGMPMHVLPQHLPPQHVLSPNLTRGPPPAIPGFNVPPMHALRQEQLPPPSPMWMPQHHPNQNPYGHIPALTPPSAEANVPLEKEVFQDMRNTVTKLFGNRPAPEAIISPQRSEPSHTRSIPGMDKYLRKAAGKSPEVPSASYDRTGPLLLPSVDHLLEKVVFKIKENLRLPVLSKEEAVRSAMLSVLPTEAIKNITEYKKICKLLEIFGISGNLSNFLKPERAVPNIPPPPDTKVQFKESSKVSNPINLFPIVHNPRAAARPNTSNEKSKPVPATDSEKMVFTQRLAAVLVNLGFTDVSTELLVEMVHSVGTYNAAMPLKDISEGRIVAILNERGYFRP